MFETSFPSFPGRDCPSERTGRTVHRQFTIAFLFMTLHGRWGKEKQELEFFTLQLISPTSFHTYRSGSETCLCPRVWRREEAWHSASTAGWRERSVRIPY